MDIVELIDNISKILIYFLPGRIFLSVFSYFLKKQVADSYYVVSISISYLFVSIYRMIFNTNGGNEEAGIVLLSSIVLAMLLGTFCKSKKFEKLHVFVTNRSIHRSVLDDIIDPKYNTYVKLYISSDEVIYYGLYKGHEDHEGDNYILITDYDVKDYNGNKKVDYTDDRSCWATINTKDISRIEVFYNAKSEKAIKIINKWFVYFSPVRQLTQFPKWNAEWLWVW